LPSAISAAVLIARAGAGIAEATADQSMTAIRVEATNRIEDLSELSNLP
jgi:hypothetical protein